MSRCLVKLPHDCGSSDALQVFEEGGNLSGYCFSCGEYVPDPMGEGKTLDESLRSRGWEKLRKR